MKVVKASICTKLSRLFNEEHERLNMVFDSSVDPVRDCPDLVLLPDTEEFQHLAQNLQRDFPGCQIQFQPMQTWHVPIVEGDSWLVAVVKMDGEKAVSYRWMSGRYRKAEAEFMRKGVDSGDFNCWVPPGEIIKLPDCFADEIYTAEQLAKFRIAPGTLLTGRTRIGPPKEDPYLNWVLSGPGEDEKKGGT